MKIMRKKQKKTASKLISGTNKELIIVRLSKRQKVITWMSIVCLYSSN